jgi:integrase
MTFTEQSRIYLSKLERRRSKPIKPTTLATFRSIVRLVEPKIGALALADIESENLRQLVEYLGEKKPETIGLALRVAKAVIASAVDDRGRPLVSKQWNGNHIDCPSIVREEKRLITAERIEGVLQNSDSPFRELFSTQAATGLRIGELLALNVEDFDASSGVIRVKRTRSYHGETSPKTTAGVREVDLHPDIVAMLQRKLGDRIAGRLFELSVNQVRYAFEGVNIQSHALRHFRYTHLLMSNIPQPVRDFWIGHSAAGMEKIYGHVAQNKELRQRLAREIGLGFTLPEASV